MTTHANRLFAVGLLGLLLSTSACLMRRDIVRVDDHPSKNVTVMETVDHYPFVVRHRFWECSEDPEKLICNRSCDGNGELECHAIMYGGYSNLD